MTTDLSGRRSQARTGGAAVEREIDAALAQQAADREERYQAARASWARDKALEGTYSRDDVLNARAVRTATGWYRVIRVNATTVTIADNWGIGTRRIPFTKIREARS